MKQLIIALLVAFLVFGCSLPKENTSQENISRNISMADIAVNASAVNASWENTTSTNATNITKIIEQEKRAAGELFVALTDSPINTTAISSLNITVKKVEIYRNGSWITLSSSKASFDLIKLKGQLMYVLNKTIDAGNYSKLNIALDDSGLFTMENSSYQYKIPIEELLFAGRFDVTANETTSVMLDFELGNKGLVWAGGGYLLRPTVRLETKKNVRAAVSLGAVAFEGGELLTSKKLVYRDLVPAAMLQNLFEECVEDCEDYCTGIIEECDNKCREKISYACDISGDDCRDRCDITLPPYMCRDYCTESSSSCRNGLFPECRSQCNATIAGCANNCQQDCNYEAG